MRRSGGLRGSLQRSAVAGLVMVLAATLAACEADSQPPPAPTSTAASPDKPTQLSFGVYGPPEEIAAFESVVESYNVLAGGSEVTLRSWPDRQGMLHSLESGGKVPDVFLASRTDLAGLRERRLTAPVDALLDERGVDFGDGYSRDALQAFSADNRLQCMPYGISPRVIYYNTDLVDFDRMDARGLDVPDLTDASSIRWNFDQFQAAAEFATRPRQGTRGLYIDPTLRGLAPFIVSGGGSVFDDPEAPTSLAFSDGDTQAALERTLELLRDPQLTLTERQLVEGPAAGVVRARSARDDRGHPRAGAAAAAGAGSELRRDADADARHRRHDRRHHGDVPVGTVRGRRRGGGLHGARALERRREPRGPGGLPRSGQPRGGALRRVPPAGTPAPARSGLQLQRSLAADQSAALGPDRARERGRRDPAAAAQRPGARPRRADHPDRRAVPGGARSRGRWDAQ